MKPKEMQKMLPDLLSKERWKNKWTSCSSSSLHKTQIPLTQLCLPIKGLQPTLKDWPVNESNLRRIWFQPNKTMPTALKSSAERPNSMLQLRRIPHLSSGFKSGYMQPCQPQSATRHNPHSTQILEVNIASSQQPVVFGASLLDSPAVMSILISSNANSI